MILWIRSYLFILFYKTSPTKIVRRYVPPSAIKFLGRFVRILRPYYFQIKSGQLYFSVSVWLNNFLPGAVYHLLRSGVLALRFLAVSFYLVVVKSPIYLLKWVAGRKNNSVRRAKPSNIRMLLKLRGEAGLYRYTPLEDIADSTDKNLRLLKKSPPWPQRQKRYKDFKCFGEDVDLPLRGGDVVSGLSVHTVAAKNAWIYGEFQGVFQGQRALSLIETPGAPQEFGCFFQDHISPVSKNLIVMAKLFVKKKQLKKVVFFSGTHGYATNYFHFMADSLPSLMTSLQTLKKQRQDFQDFIVLVPSDSHKSIKDIVKQTSAFYGLQTLEFSKQDAFDCEEVVMSGYSCYMAIALPTKHNYSVSPLMMRFTRRVLNHIFPYKTSLRQNLYVSRGNASGTGSSRHVANFQQIRDFLSRLAFNFVLSPKLKLQEQVELFRGAEHVVFDGGAAISNLLFAPHCRGILLLAMNRGTDPSLFVSFCQALGIEISYACGNVCRNQEGIDSWQRSYEIPLKYLQDGVAHMLKNERDHGLSNSGAVDAFKNVEALRASRADLSNG